MKLEQYPTGQQVAGAVADHIAALLKDKPDALLCLAAGHSSLPVFEELARRQAAGEMDFTRTKFISMDEWVGVAAETPGACTQFLQANLFGPLGIPPQNICVFDGMAEDLAAECARVEGYIDAQGGIDYMMLGLGMNGHLALNEPGDKFANGAHVAPLSATTMEVAPKYFPQGMPPITQGVTLGLRNIRACKSIDLVVIGAHKKGPVEQLMRLEPTEDFPATILKTTPGTRFLLDEAAWPDAM